MKYSIPLLTLGVFVISLGVFAFLQAAPSFPDPDSFYHATMALLTRTGPVHSFPWLPLTTLQNNFVDHHYLYHLLLIPFVSFGDPLIGIKVATALLAAAFMAFFTWMVAWVLKREYGITSWLTLLAPATLLCTQFFATRLNLAKVPALSLIWLFAGLWCIFARRPRVLFVLSFFYVWLYSGWPLIIIVSIIAALVRKQGQEQFFKKTAPDPVFAMAGCMAGLIINPYFPENISFYWIQIVKIAVLNNPSRYNAGGEWAPPGFDFVPLSFFVIVPLLAAGGVLAARKIFGCSLDSRFRVNDKNGGNDKMWKEQCMGVLSVVFLVLAMRSGRHIEYFAPIAVLFSSLVLIPLAENGVRSSFLKKLLLTPFSRITVGAICASSIFLAGINIAILFHNFWRQKERLADARAVSTWIANHTSEGEIIFHDRWDDFPPLLYYNRHNRYVLGLDPRFMAEKNPTLLAEYQALLGGSVKRNVGTRIAKNFGTRLVLVRKKNSALLALYDTDKTLEQVYDGSFARVYHVKNR